MAGLGLAGPSASSAARGQRCALSHRTETVRQVAYGAGRAGRAETMGGKGAVRIDSGRSHHPRRSTETCTGIVGCSPDRQRAIASLLRGGKKARRQRLAGVRCGTANPARAPLPAQAAHAFVLDGGCMPSRARLRLQTSCACPLSPTPTARSHSAGPRRAPARRLYPAGT